MIPITTNSMPGSARVREDYIDYVTIETRNVAIHMKGPRRAVMSASRSADAGLGAA